MTANQTRQPRLAYNCRRQRHADEPSLMSANTHPRNGKPALLVKSRVNNHRRAQHRPLRFGFAHLTNKRANFRIQTKPPPSGSGLDRNRENLCRPGQFEWRCCGCNNSGQNSDVPGDLEKPDISVLSKTTDDLRKSLVPWRLDQSGGPALADLDRSNDANASVEGLTMNWNQRSHF